MNIYKAILIFWLACAALVTVSSVGKPRKPIEAIVAAWSLVFTGGLITLVVLA